MTSPQKNAPARSGQGSSTQSPPSAALPPGLTAAHFTDSELRALQLICRDADNDVYAKNLLATAIARAEGDK